MVSYASALGASILIWQHLLHHELHWTVAPISFIALVAVGADYNLLLAMRIREEARAGLGTGIIRAFAATGGVVTTAGIVFGITMFALAGSSVLSVAQIGVTIGVGLLLDTLVVRTFVLPSIVALLGRWFWWPTPDTEEGGPHNAVQHIGVHVGESAAVWGPSGTMLLVIILPLWRVKPIAAGVLAGAGFGDRMQRSQICGGRPASRGRTASG